MGYIQPGSPEALRGVKSEPIEIQAGRPFSTHNVPTTPVQQPNTEKPQGVEVQRADPFANPSPGRTENHQQFDADRRPAPIPHESLHSSRKLLASLDDDPPSAPYAQLGAGPYNAAWGWEYDPSLIKLVCPFCSSPARHTGSSAAPWRCDGSLTAEGYGAISHQFGLDSFGNWTTADGSRSVSGLPELGTPQSFGL